jgi:hypothetical protein
MSFLTHTGGTGIVEGQHCLSSSMHVDSNRIQTRPMLAGPRRHSPLRLATEQMHEASPGTWVGGYWGLDL